MGSRITVCLAVLLCAATAVTVPAGLVPPAAGQAEPDPHAARAAQVLDELSLPQRVSQLVMTSVPGAVIDAGQAGELVRLQLGGIILFSDNYRSRRQLRRLTRRLAEVSRPFGGPAVAPLIAVDQEGGVVRRLPDVPPDRSHPQLGRTDRPGLTRRQAAASGQVLRELGISMSLAPVADLDHGPHHVMQQRSFGLPAARTGEHVAAFVRGLDDARVAASVKHFPGFGAAQVNSDDALARIARTRRQLRDDLLPFRAAIEADAASIMVSHAVYRALDRRRPASTSPAVYRLLRHELGYDGIAITDSLQASGFREASGMDAAAGCVATVAAGADIALLTGPLRAAAACRSKLVVAVRTGRIPSERIDESALRVLRLKSQLGLLDAVGS